MQSRKSTLCLLVASVCLVAGSPLVAQSGAPADSIHACDLVTNADVTKVTGRPLEDPPGRLSTKQKTESGCEFRDAAVDVALISASLTRQFLSRAMSANGFDTTAHPVSAVGDSALIFFAPKGRDPEGWLVAYAGTRTVTVRVKMEPDQTSESAQTPAVALAKIALSRLH